MDKIKSLIAMWLQIPQAKNYHFAKWHDNMISKLHHFILPLFMEVT